MQLLNKKKKKEKTKIEPSGILYTIIPEDYIRGNIYYDKSVMAELVKNNKGTPKFKIV